MYSLIACIVHFTICLADFGDDESLGVEELVRRYPWIENPRQRSKPLMQIIQFQHSSAVHWEMMVTSRAYF